MILCYAYASEVVYPIKETTASGIFLFWVLTISTLSTDLMKYGVVELLNNKLGALLVIAYLCLVTLIGLLLSISMKPIDYENIAYLQSKVVSGSFMDKQAYHKAKSDSD